MPKVIASGNGVVAKPAARRPSAKPTLVNRGPAGLLAKKVGTAAEPTPTPEQIAAKGPINNISEGLLAQAVEIDTLVPDPDNARLHPDRNMDAIVASLAQYGQVKPIVVRRSNNIVVAGNGTLEAAKQLGWTLIAANFVDFDDAQAAGYGLADNRTAELARWDFEVVARLDRLLVDAGHGQIGWSKDELEVLRAADWTPPAIDEDADDGTGPQGVVITLTAEQAVVLQTAIEVGKAEFQIEDDVEVLLAILGSYASVRGIVDNTGEVEQAEGADDAEEN